MSQHRRTETIVTECTLDSPPAKVWRALTTPHLLAGWLAAGVTGTAVGDRFTLEGVEPADCQVLESAHESRLRLAWRRDDLTPPLDSTVTFEISETADGGTWLRIRHEGLPATALLAEPRRIRTPRPASRRMSGHATLLRMAA